MTDTQSVNVSLDSLKDVAGEISAIDEKLDAGSPNAGKRAIKNSLVNSLSTNEEVQGAVSQLTGWLKGIEDEEARTAAYLTFVRSLNDEFGDDVDAFVEKQVKENKTDVAAPSDEEVAKLTDARKDLKKKYDALKGVLEMVGVDVSSVPEPKIRRGGKGPRGPRVTSQFQYAVNGENLPEADNSLTTIGKRVGMSTKDLKAFLKENGVSLEKGKVTNDWNVTLPNGTAVSGTRFEQYRNEEADVDGEEEAEEGEGDEE